MRVQHNIPAMNAYRNYNNNSTGINKNLERLSSGYKINRAGDDAAGLAISEKMRAQISGLEVAQKNAKDGISLVQTAEGALTEVQDMLNRMYKLAEQSANGTYAGDGTTTTKIDREQLNKEVNRLRDEIDRIANTANFNGTKLLNGDLASGSSSGSSSVKAEVAAGDTTGIKLSGTPTVESGLSGKSLTASVTANTGYNLVTFNDISGYTLSVAKNTSSTGTGNAMQNSGKWIAQSTAGLVDVTITDSSDATKTTTVTLDLSSAAVGSFTLNFTAASGSGSDGVTSSTGTVATAMKDTPDQFTVSGLVLWIGAEAQVDNALTVNIDSIKSSDLAITSTTVDISTQSKALSSLRYIEAAIDKVSDIRGTLGATQNRLEHTINNLSAMQENMQDAESSIRDTDVAEEMMKYTKNSILVQSAQAMLAQANQLPQGVLQLLQ